MFSFVTRVCCTCDRGIRYAWYVRSKKKNSISCNNTWAYPVAQSPLRWPIFSQQNTTLATGWPENAPAHNDTGPTYQSWPFNIPLDIHCWSPRREKKKKTDLVWQRNFKFSRFAPESPQICPGNFSMLRFMFGFAPSSFRRIRRLEFCLRTFTYGFAIWILPPTGSLFGVAGVMKYLYPP